MRESVQGADAGLATSASPAALLNRARSVLVGGVNSPVRAMRSIDREPIFIDRGEGAYIYDVDGRGYIDLVSSWGALIAGHAHPQVVAAATRAAQAGTSYGAPTVQEVELAELVADRVPSAQMVRMTCSGTEAVMSAVRLARAATERQAIVKFAGAYHGHSDGLLAQAGSGLATQGLPASPGVTEAQAADTIVCEWNDFEALDAALSGRSVAAVLAEPYPANMGFVAPQEGFLSFLRKRASQAGALLIFDEVISGFRVASGGAQQRENVYPDITVLGKIFGGGFPAACYAGSRELMCQIAPEGPVYQAGTLAGNPVAVAAGIATLKLCDESAYQRLSELSNRLAARLASASARCSQPVQVAHTTGLVTVFFADREITDYQTARSCDTRAYAAFCRALLDRGIYVPPSQFEAWFPSLAHTEQHVDEIGAAAEEAFASL